MRDTPMQRICSELTEKLLKSLDKEYNVSKGGVWCVAARCTAPSPWSVRANGYRPTLDPPCAVLLPVPVTCARVPARVTACMCMARVYVPRVYVCVCMCPRKRGGRDDPRECMSVAAATAVVAVAPRRAVPRDQPDQPHCSSLRLKESTEMRRTTVRAHCRVLRMASARSLGSLRTLARSLARTHTRTRSSAAVVFVRGGRKSKREREREQAGEKKDESGVT